MKFVVTGAAGFVGTNLSLELAKRGDETLLIDDLSRDGVLKNRDLIESCTGKQVHILDISDIVSMEKILDKFGTPDMFINLAGQVSLMASIRNPVRDFMVNAYAPIMTLEYFRRRKMNPIFLNLSSNKVYGDLSQFQFNESLTRFEISGSTRDFDENTQLNFYGPYGCSKGTSDQYLIDYARIFGMRTISFRQSTIYGPHQQPASDQGWVVFMIDQILKGSTISLNGNGKQVRDILHVSDIVELILLIPTLEQFPFGETFNVGGGLSNTLSILELFALVESETGLSARYTFGEMRPGDQKYYVSNLQKIMSHTNWKPTVDVLTGIHSVINERQSLLSS